MKAFLTIVGGIWATIGVINMYWVWVDGPYSDGGLVYAFFVILFIFPGLVLVGLGYQGKEWTRPLF